ncbi:hypothetical protein [Nocardioides bizhenqiangii]|uniref:Lipoprotein n=1 Tax=Nocardioides bizhenqiangii TaxID=3095076 RepID=A0ABZ0ZTU5_9ACTN|nr:hypothetical protein [Nocardioides sp. HM61]WQQ27642.1 hypothetical protein SHK19_05255 [Nocardioides sp. HM61]
MKQLLLPLASLSVLVAALGACGADDGDGGTDAGSDGLASVELTEDLGCGYGFAVSDKAERALLSVHHNAEPGAIERTVSLPDPAWDAQVLVGTHLAANWCNDLIEEPQAEVDETWEIVEGTLEFVGEVPATGDSPADQPVRAELSGVVAQSPDGERVELGDLSLTNGAWGFFAG